MSLTRVTRNESRSADRSEIDVSSAAGPKPTSSGPARTAPDSVAIPFTASITNETSSAGRCFERSAELGIVSTTDSRVAMSYVEIAGIVSARSDAFADTDARPTCSRGWTIAFQPFGSDCRAVIPWVMSSSSEPSSHVSPVSRSTSDVSLARTSSSVASGSVDDSSTSTEPRVGSSRNGGNASYERPETTVEPSTVKRTRSGSATAKAGSGGRWISTVRASVATARYGVGQCPMSGGPSSTGTVTLVMLVKLVTLVTFGGQKVPFVAFEPLVPFVGGTGTHALTFALAAARAAFSASDTSSTHQSVATMWRVSLSHCFDT